ncbi:MAG: PEP-utilizing enzyme [Patescibacteria group bacterium]
MLMSQAEIVKKIKSKNWDNRVQRPGFFQSKQIVVEALTQKTEIAPSVFVHDTNSVWVKNSGLYDQDYTDKLFSNIFPEAFSKDKYWPLSIIDKLDKASERKDLFVTSMSELDYSEIGVTEKVRYIKTYVRLLCDIQRYYCFAVPLTNYCETFLRKHDESLLEYAVQYKALDVDNINESLWHIKQAHEEGNTIESGILIDEHLQKFAWIKSNYNIVEEYRKDEVLNEIRSDIQIFKPRVLPQNSHTHIATGLQAGIYLRNRMKELSQQVWFAYENLALRLAKELSLSREDFLQIHYKDVLGFLETGDLRITSSEIKARHQGFVEGILEGEEFVLTGAVVEELSNHFNSVSVEGLKELSGSVACKGVVIGKVKVVRNVSEAGKLKEGDILVTSMTTPDFIVAMKRAGAIVTDEGGLSCHAAIVSREMRKPCIIGTKLATKLLKDGDMVEVNADIGIVRILHK